MLFLILPGVSPASDGDTAAVKGIISAWHKTLTDGNMDAHLDYYDASYPFDIYPHSMWREEKEAWTESPTPFTLTLSEPDIRMEDGTAVADFIETFKRLSTLAIGKKRLTLAKRQDRWRIVSEEWLRYIFDLRLDPQVAAQAQKADSLRISMIEYICEADRPEKVCVLLDRFAVPDIIALEGEKPRIAVDFKNTPPLEKHRDIRAGGFLVRKIRTHYHADERKLRMVLDLDPLEDFQVDPVFYKSENRYCLTVSRNTGSNPGKTE